MIAVSVFDVLEQHGATKLVAFVAAVALFLLLHLIRLPFRAIERGLRALQRGLDARIATHVTVPTGHPFPADSAA